MTIDGVEYYLGTLLSTLAILNETIFESKALSSLLKVKHSLKSPFLCFPHFAYHLALSNTTWTSQEEISNQKSRRKKPAAAIPKLNFEIPKPSSLRVQSDEIKRMEETRKMEKKKEKERGKVKDKNRDDSHPAVEVSSFVVFSC
jgi:hypothetical protein